MFRSIINSFTIKSISNHLLQRYKNVIDREYVSVNESMRQEWALNRLPLSGFQHQLTQADPLQLFGTIDLKYNILSESCCGVGPQKLVAPITFIKPAMEIMILCLALMTFKRHPTGVAIFFFDGDFTIT
jgi:hypothetical protein